MTAISNTHQAVETTTPEVGHDLELYFQALEDIGYQFCGLVRAMRHLQGPLRTRPSHLKLMRARRKLDDVKQDVISQATQVLEARLGFPPFGHSVDELCRLISKSPLPVSPSVQEGLGRNLKDSEAFRAMALEALDDLWRCSDADQVLRDVWWAQWAFKPRSLPIKRVKVRRVMKQARNLRVTQQRYKGDPSHPCMRDIDTHRGAIVAHRAVVQPLSGQIYYAARSAWDGYPVLPGLKKLVPGNRR